MIFGTNHLKSFKIVYNIGTNTSICISFDLKSALINYFVVKEIEIFCSEGFA